MLRLVLCKPKLFGIFNGKKNFSHIRNINLPLRGPGKNPLKTGQRLPFCCRVGYFEGKMQKNIKIFYSHEKLPYSLLFEMAWKYTQV